MKGQGHMESACEERPLLWQITEPALYFQLLSGVPELSLIRSHLPPQTLFSTASRKASWHSVLSTKAPMPKQDVPRGLADLILVAQ